MSVARRTLVLLFVLLGLGVPAAAMSSALPVQGGSTDTTVVADDAATDDADLSCAKPGVKRPNCGVKPEQAGDRGGTLQYAVWTLLIIGLAIIFTVVFRSAKRTNDAKVAEVGDRNWS